MRVVIVCVVLAALALDVIYLTKPSQPVGKTGFSSINKSADQNWHPLSWMPDGKTIVQGPLQGMDMVFTLKLRNEDVEPVQLTSTSATCTCTKVKSDRDVLNAGEVAMISGTVQGRPDSNSTIIGVDVRARGLKSHRTSLQRKSVEVKYASSLVITPRITSINLDQKLAVPTIGDVQLKNASAFAADVKISYYGSGNIRPAPSTIVIPPGETREISLHVPDSHECAGTMMITVDNGREHHRVPVKALVPGSVTAHPKTLVLGAISANSGTVESKFPARLLLKGENLKSGPVRITHYPQLLKNPICKQISETEVEVSFDLTTPPDTSGILDPIQIEISEPNSERFQALEIPVIAVFRRLGRIR